MRFRVAPSSKNVFTYFYKQAEIGSAATTFSPPSTYYSTNALKYHQIIIIYTRGESGNHLFQFVPQKSGGVLIIMKAKDKIIVALDVSSYEEAEKLVRQLVNYVGGFKIGLELITSPEPGIVIRLIDLIHSLGGNVFYDIKLNDIPNTVGKSAKNIAALGVKMFNVHASSSIGSMSAALNNKGKSLVLAVTVLTSMGASDVKSTFGLSTKEAVLHFAVSAKLAGLDGIICSSQELEMLKESGQFDNFIKVTPGVRPIWSSLNDQKRVTTPAEAIKAGATYLVIGRPITKPPEEIGSPIQAAIEIAKEINSALGRDD